MLPLGEYLIKKEWMEDATKMLGEIFDVFPKHSLNLIEYLFTTGIASFMCDPHGDSPSIVSSDEVIYRINVAHDAINIFDKNKYRNVTPELVAMIHAKCWELIRRHKLLNYHDTVTFIEKEIAWFQENGHCL